MEGGTETDRDGLIDLRMTSKTCTCFMPTTHEIIPFPLSFPHIARCLAAQRWPLVSHNTPVCVSYCP